MAKAIQTRNNLTMGFALIPTHGNRLATVREFTHDGDTITVSADGVFSIRFLGIDTPEIFFQFPKIGSINDDKWVPIPKFSNYLADPFNPRYIDSERYAISLGSQLVNYLKEKLGPETADNHQVHADHAQRELERIIQLDISERISQGENFRFFMAFAYEIMDQYGRFLCYVDRDNKPDERIGRLTYNERMLEAGCAVPYFIFPNIDPFRKSPSIIHAVPPASKFLDVIESDVRLTHARYSVKKARQNSAGIFRSDNPLRLFAFELRFLARRKPPTRHIIDMSSEKGEILKPTEYYLIENIEDRLFIDDLFLPLFEKKGYDLRS